jgi:hypothetical protein
VIVSSNPIGAIQKTKEAAGLSKSSGETFDFSTSYIWGGRLQVLDLCTGQRVVTFEVADRSHLGDSATYTLVALDKFLAGLGQTDLTPTGVDLFRKSTQDQLKKMRAKFQLAEDALGSLDLDTTFKYLGDLYVSMFDYRNQLAQAK